MEFFIAGQALCWGLVAAAALLWKKE